MNPLSCVVLKLDQLPKLSTRTIKHHFGNQTSISKIVRASPNHCSWCMKRICHGSYPPSNPMIKLQDMTTSCLERSFITLGKVFFTPHGSKLTSHDRAGMRSKLPPNLRSPTPSASRQEVSKHVENVHTNVEGNITARGESRGTSSNASSRVILRYLHWKLLPLQPGRS